MSDNPPDIRDSCGPISIQARRQVYSGFRTLYDVTYTHDEAHAPHLTGTQSREIADIGKIAAVLPYDPARDQVILLRQVRAGAELAGVASNMIEVVAGLVDPGETVADAARRETLEEAGVAVLDLIEAFRFMPSPGFTTELATLFCARVDTGSVPKLTGEASEGEVIETVVVSPDAALAALDGGDLANSYTINALLWFARHRERIRAAWSQGA